MGGNLIVITSLIERLEPKVFIVVSNIWNKDWNKDWNTPGVSTGDIISNDCKVVFHSWEIQDNTILIAIRYIFLKN